MKRRYLFDTGIAQDFQARRNGIRERAIDHRANGPHIGICVPNDLSAISGIAVENWTPS
jgi:hypothetical protein